jgi:hypothetical protein
MLKAKIIALRGVKEFIRNSMLDVTKRNHRKNFVLLHVKRAYKEQFTKSENKPPQPPDKLSFFKN